MHLEKRVLVTGGAGFLGSHLCERLIDEGREVVGVDCFSTYYSRRTKERNLERLRDEPHFRLVELDLSRGPLRGLLDGIDVVFHLAARAGVRGSFGESFREYVRDNVIATQRLLEEAARAGVLAFVYASSSSVYGDSRRYPTVELSERRPVSPYGMTKVATEELATVYRRCFGVPVMGLRYFTAYGPRQRPDMAFSRFFDCALAGVPLPINGDGRQVRDVLCVDDLLRAFEAVRAALPTTAGQIYNVGGGLENAVSLIELMEMIEKLTGSPLEYVRDQRRPGDQLIYVSDCSKLARDTGWRPEIRVPETLNRIHSWWKHNRELFPATEPETASVPALMPRMAS